MGYRRSQFDVAHALTADAGFGNLNAAAITYDTFISDFLIFSAVTLPVLARSEDFLAIQTILFRFQRTIVDGLRLGHFSMRPFKNRLRRRKTYLNRIKAHWLIVIILRHFRHERHLLYSSKSISSSRSMESSPPKSSSSGSTSTSSSPLNSCFPNPWAPKDSSSLSKRRLSSSRIERMSTSP